MEFLQEVWFVSRSLKEQPILLFMLKTATTCDPLLVCKHYPSTTTGSFNPNDNLDILTNSKVRMK